MSVQNIDTTLFDTSGHQDVHESTKVVVIRRELQTDIYVFFVESSNRNLVYRKSTDGGVTFGAQVLIKTGTGFLNDGVCVWYDQWTPGDNSGNLIHILDYIEGIGTGEARYFVLDTSNDTFATNNDTQIATGTFGFGNDGQFNLIKATNGELWYSRTSNSGAGPDVLRSTDSGATWASIENGAVGALSSASDGLFIMPLADSGSNIADILGIHTDVVNSRLQFAIFNNTTDLWDVSFTVLETGITQFGPPVPQIAASLNKTTGDIYFVYVAGTAFGDPDASFAFRRFDNSTRTFGSKVFITSDANNIGTRNQLNEMKGPAITHHQTDNILMTAVVLGDNSVDELQNTAYFLSSDEGLTWSDPIFPPGSNDREIRKINMPILGVLALEGWYSTFHAEAAQTLIGWEGTLPLEFFSGTVRRRTNGPSTPQPLENVRVTVTETAPRAAYGKNFGKNRAYQGSVLSDAAGAYKCAVFPNWANEVGTLNYQAQGYLQGTTDVSDMMDLSREDTED